MSDETRVGGAAGAAIGLSGISAFLGLCCLGPWAVSLFGVSAAITIVRYDFLRPYLLAVAAVALAWAFWRVYRPSPDRTGPSPWLQGSLWFAAVLTVAAFFADQLQWWLIDPTPEGLR